MTDLERAAGWLARHGLGGTAPTPLLVARLAVRRRARMVVHLVLAVVVLAAAFAQAFDRLSTSRSGGFQAHRPAPLVALTGLLVGLLVAHWLLHRWVRRVDRRTGATLSRRAAHPVQPGWQAVVGTWQAVVTAATFAGGALFALAALSVGDASVRYAAAVLLIGLAGVAAATAVQLRDVLERPVVAEDEVSLTVDLIMRVEDARELTSPGIAPSMPVVLLLGTVPAWWNAAILVFVALTLGAHLAIYTHTPPSVTVARQAMSAR